MALTDTQLRNAKPAEKDYTITDGQGLSILITSKGGIHGQNKEILWHGLCLNIASAKGKLKLLILLQDPMKQEIDNGLRVTSA